VIVRTPVARVRRPRAFDESPRPGVDRHGLRSLLDAGAASGVRDLALVCLLALNGLRVSHRASPRPRRYEASASHQ
jgi:hypothetical protein